MKTTLFKTILAALLLAVNLPLSIYAQGTAFTYQGRLNYNGNPANGVYDLKFSLFNASAEGSPLAGPMTASAVTVSNGLFTTLVDFGSGVFTGGSNWLEIAVSTNGADNFTTLASRQPISPVPNAVFAVSAGNLLNTNFTGNFEGNGSGIQNLSPANIAPGPVHSMLTFDNPENVFNGSFQGIFRGDGSNILNLSPMNIAPGPVHSMLTFDNPENVFNGSFQGIFRGDGSNILNLSPMNIAPGPVHSMLTFDNPGNVFNGSFQGIFEGDGSNILNLSPINIAPGAAHSMLTFDNPGNVFNGSFQGDGSGLANVQANAVTGGLTTNIIVSIPTGTATLCFTNGILQAVR